MLYKFYNYPTSTFYELEAEGIDDAIYSYFSNTSKDNISIVWEFSDEGDILGFLYFNVSLSSGPLKLGEDHFIVSYDSEKDCPVVSVIMIKKGEYNVCNV